MSYLRTANRRGMPRLGFEVVQPCLTCSMELDLTSKGAGAEDVLTLRPDGVVLGTQSAAL
jgi:hypothetical protein